MIAVLLSLQILTADKPVMRLDQVTIEGNIRKPALVEISSSKLDSKVEEAALKSLMRLEDELLKPALPPETN